MAKFKEPTKTVKAYKMFRVDPKQPSKLFPLFVDANTPVPMNEWVEAKEGEMSNGKVKSKIGPLAYRPGWHAGDLPLATHIGDKDEEQKAEISRVNKLREGMLADIGYDKEAQKIAKKMYPYPAWVSPPRLRNPRHIWAEIEMPHDVDWQSEADKRGYNDQGKFIANQAHITDQLPKGGHYRYKTNSNMTGNWLIGGAMKVNRILDDKEVKQINDAAGTADLPRLTPMKKEKFGFAGGGTVAPDEWKAEEHVNYRDPKSTKIEDWKWRKMSDVRKDVPIREIPDYIQGGYGEFMKQQQARAKAGQLSPRDLLKAFTITQSSIGRGGLSHATATKTGMKLPNTGGEVRPEGAFAEWLGSPMGQKYLNAAEQGLIDPAALADIQQKFSPFGKHNQLIDQMAYAAHTIPSMSQGMNQAVTGSTEDYRDWAEKLKGIAGAKSGFIGSMLGRGDLPTLDARQLNLHTLPAKVGVGSIMSRGKGKGAREAVDRLAARQHAMNLKLDPSMAPHYQHLAHHAVWDAMGKNKTTHDDLMKAMRGYADGGVAHLAIGGQGPKNWMKGSVEDVVNPMLEKEIVGNKHYPHGPELDEATRQRIAELQQAASKPGYVGGAPKVIEHLQEKLKAPDVHKAAMNQWVQRNLTNYIKKQMATHDDPIRKLAEQGIVHMPPEQMGYGSSQAEMVRKTHGAPRLGQSPEAQAWEDAADVSMMPYKIKDLEKLSHRPNVKKEPWMEKADPETQVYMPLDNMHAHYLGFDHLVDILKQDLAEGRLRPEQLSKVSIEHAVRRAHEYDQEQKRKMAETALKATEGMPVHKEYPEGYKWIELALNKELPEGHTISLSGTYVDPQGNESIYHPNYGKLEDALKYEGDTMGHCVGGYCPDVASGKSRIFSLRDAKNEPHVTVEVKPSDITKEFRNLPDQERWNLSQHVKDKYFGGAMPGASSEDKYWQLLDQAYIEKYGEPQPSIRQIKGKGNAKPKKDYIPYVQDFVKSGKWSDVGDLRNADLFHVHPASDIAENMTKAGESVPTYVTNEELTGLLKKYRKANGGTVHMADGGDMDQMQLAMMNKQLGMYKAADRAKAGRMAAEAIKKEPEMRASEALGQLREKGFKRTTTTQADRTRVGGGNIGGAAFPAISNVDPEYAGKAWGVMDTGTASRLTNLTDPQTAWTTMLGSATQLKTNPIVFDKLKRQFQAAMKQGLLTPELEAAINHNLALTFGAGADIRDPKIWKMADTFDKRAALADLMMGQGVTPKKGGVPLGGEKSGKGVIFQPTQTLMQETEPGLHHPEHGGNVPTFAAGPRLFQLEKSATYRPDLHPGFPMLIHGQDLGKRIKPVPTEAYLPDWHKAFKKANPSRKKPGYYDLALGVKGQGLPSQELTDAYLRHLIMEGFKRGGAVRMADGGQVDVQKIGVNEAPNMDVKAFFPPRPAQGNMLPVGGVQQAPMQPQQPPAPQPQPSGQPPMQPNPPMPGQQLQQQPSNILQMTRQGQAMSAIRPPQMAHGGHIDRDMMMFEMMNRKMKVKHG